MSQPPQAPQSSVTQIDEVTDLDHLGRIAMEWAAPELFERAPKLIFLRGPMGAGKTAFVSKLAGVLGTDESASPSFALHTRYEGIRGAIDHFDLDRLASREDFESIGFWDMLSEAVAESERGSGAGRRFIAIEWASRLEEFGLGAEGAAWTRGFRAWTFQFEGPPKWRLLRRRL